MKRFLFILILCFLIPAYAHAIKYKGDLESNESVTLPEQGVAPANPATGKKKVYVKSDGLHVLDSAGVDQFLNPFTLADEAKLDGIETAATADQTNAEIKTAYEANANTNEFDDAEQSKLAGIEALADVTDATNVAAAGAVMDSDISEAEGFLRKTGAGTYVGLKSNLNASTDPGATDDSSAGYAVSSLWINTTLDKIWQAVDVTVSAASWKDLTASGSGTTFVGLTDTPGTITADQVVVGNSAGTALVFSSTAGNPHLSTGNVLANHKALVVLRASITTVDVDADDVMLENSGGVYHRASSVNLTAAITCSGAINCLDTGSEAASTWYHVWVIYNGTTVASLLSISSTAPTLPAGYTFKGLVGAVKNNSSSDFKDFEQDGVRVSLPAEILVTNGSATTLTSFNLDPLVPPLAKAAMGSWSLDHDTGGLTAGIIATSSSGLAELVFRGNTSTDKAGGYWDSAIRTAQTLWYRVTSSLYDMEIRVHGYEY